MSNIVDPDQTMHSVVYGLGLQYLLRSVCPNYSGKYSSIQSSLSSQNNGNAPDYRE